MVQHPTLAQLERGLDHIGQSPRGEGTVEMIVRRPRVDSREVLDEAMLDLAEGLVGDRWGSHARGRTPEATPDRETQLNIMNARVIALVAQERERWPLAGDQLYVDLDLSAENLPPGTRLAIGSAVIEVTAAPHTGCGKFAARFGFGAVAFVNSPAGKQQRLRGINARVVQPGVVRTGDPVRKLVATREDLHAG